MVRPAVHLVGFLVKAVVDPIRVAVGDQNGRYVVRYYVGVGLVILIVAYCLCFSRLAIPVVFDFDRVFVRVVIEYFDHRIFDDAFRTCSQGDDARGGLLSFFHVGVGTNSVDHACAFAFRDGNDDVRLCQNGQFKRADTRVRVLISYPSFKGAVSLGNT